MGNFHYPALLGLLNGVAFKKCVSQIFPLLNYQYMREEDVRKVDLCEKLNDLANLYPMTAEQGKKGSYPGYYAALKNYFYNYLKCKENSLAAEYCERAKSIIKDIEKSEATFDSLFTLFAIYLGLSREMFPDYKPGTVEDMNIFAGESDFELLKKMKEHSYKNRNALILGLTKNEEQPQKEKDMIYIHNVIMLCCLLQNQGEYVEGE